MRTHCQSPGALQQHRKSKIAFYLMAVDSNFPLLFCNHVPFKPVCSSKLLAKEHDNKEKSLRSAEEATAAEMDHQTLWLQQSVQALCRHAGPLCPMAGSQHQLFRCQHLLFSSSDEGTSVQRGLRTPAQGLHEQRDVSGPHFDRSRKTTFTTSTILVPLEQKKEAELLGSRAQPGHLVFVLALNSPPKMSLSFPSLSPLSSAMQTGWRTLRKGLKASQGC